MITRAAFPRVATATVLLLGLVACERDLSLLQPAPFPADGLVFDETFGAGLSFQAFGGSKTDALDLDTNERFRGRASLRVTVPSPGDPSGGYAGGAFVANVPRNLTGFNAITFWARASQPATLNVVGIGNDNTGTSQFTAEVQNGIQLSTSWTRYIVPIPDPSVLDQEAGMFYFAEGAEGTQGYTFWLDDVRFETVSTLANVRPTIPTRTVNDALGSTVQVTGATVTVDAAGTDVVVQAAPSYFTWSSSDESVATVSPGGLVSLVGGGTATITARLGGVPAQGAFTVAVAAPPAVAAPTPDEDPAEVISLFSDVYDDVQVDTWSAVWDQADVEDIQIAGDNVKKYSNLVFAGIEFTSQQVDATDRTTLHMDLWTQDASDFRVKLVDFGADGAFGGGDDSEYELVLNAGTTPGIQVGAWNSLDIPLSAFVGLTRRANLAQMILLASSPTIYIDNVYFHGTVVAPPTVPLVAAPVPTLPAERVISLFSNAYTNVPVDTWSTVWDNADLEETQVAGDDVKKYTNLVFAGIETIATPVDASAMTHFHLDFWTPDPTGPPAEFRVKLVDLGANGVFGGGDDVEHEVVLTSSSVPAIGTGSWVSLDIPLADFTGLATRGAIGQIILSGAPNTVYLDNVYFRN
jgi:hypothetical protein